MRQILVIELKDLIWLNNGKTLDTIVIKHKLYAKISMAVFGVNAEEERNRAYEKERKSSLVSGSFLISRAGSISGYGSTGMGAENNTAGFIMTAMETKYIMNGERVQTVSGVI